MYKKLQVNLLINKTYSINHSCYFIGSYIL